MAVATIGMAHAWHGARIVQSGQLLTSEGSDELVALRRRTLSLRDGIVQHGVGRPGRAAAHLDRSAKYPVGEGEEREGRKTHNKHFCTNKHKTFFICIVSFPAPSLWVAILMPKRNAVSLDRIALSEKSILKRSPSVSLGSVARFAPLHHPAGERNVLHAP